MKLNRIKEVLDEKGISQTWLAKQLNKSYNSVNAYVCNRANRIIIRPIFVSPAGYKLF